MTRIFVLMISEVRAADTMYKAESSPALPLRAQLCESRGGRPGFPAPNTVVVPMVSVDVNVQASARVSKERLSRPFQLRACYSAIATHQLRLWRISNVHFLQKAQVIGSVSVGCEVLH